MINFDSIAIKVSQVNSLAYAIEGAIAEAPGLDVGDSKTKQMLNLFYVLQGELAQLGKDVEELSGHIAVCNAIYAVNRVNELQEEIERLKQNT